MLNKQAVNINFSQGLNTKADPKQVSMGQFLVLENSVFDKAGLLKKRNGFGPLSTLPIVPKLVTTFNDGLTAIGSSLYSYSQSARKWVNKGSLQLTTLETLPLARASTNQTFGDAVVASNGLVCTTFIDVLPSGSTYKYSVADSATGQVIVSPTAITATSGTINSSPRVFLLGNYFVIAFGTTTGHIQYIGVSTGNPEVATTAADITTSYAAATTISWDALNVNDTLYFAYNSTGGGQAIKVAALPSNLGAVIGPLVYSTQIGTMVSLAADYTNPIIPTIYVNYYDAGGSTGYSFCVTPQVHLLRNAVQWTSTAGILNIASTAQSGSCNIYYENGDTYTWGNASHSISKINVDAAGTVGSPSTVARSVGLASKAFLYNGTSYMLSAYSSTYQPTYFLIDDSGNVISKLAYSNGGGYLTTGLPNITVQGSVISIAYRIKTLIQSTNKGTDLSTSVPVNPVYSQTGINLAIFNLNVSDISTAEIGGTLNISGGLTWMFDGVKPTEQGFNLWPDDINVTTDGGGGAGSIAAGTYYYQVCYEWTDNNGNIYRSAPSLPTKIVVAAGTSTNTIKVPSLRLTYKSNVSIVVYRWSAAQPIYYAIKSPGTTPTLSDPTTNSVTITDTLADASIIGNPIIYTTGGVVENIGAPASKVLTLFNNRLFLITAEDRNLAWYSKQVIESTPVEMSDLLTQYIAPSTGAQGSTGPTDATVPMDDKIIYFKNSALYYVAGIGPDNTGANNQFSDPVFISSVVGSDNQNSIIFIPAGIMFQSDKGIWLLGRDLSTSYIGAPVETYTQNARVVSAVAIPDTNQVRFTMDSGITLMYDYFYNQWGTFTNIPAISSTLFNNLHTYVDSYGRVFQETPDEYLDNSSPVLIGFTTGWGNLAGLQGYQRFYQMLLLGEYLSPFKLNVQIAYDYNPAVVQQTVVKPINYSPAWGDDATWGSGQFWGGQDPVFDPRIFPVRQRCQSFRLTVREIYDPSYGVAAGAGLTLSGIALVVGVKRGFRVQKAIKSYG